MLDGDWSSDVCSSDLLISKAIFIDTDPNTKNEHILMGIIQIGAGLDAEELLAQSVEAMHSAAPTDTPPT
jgi:hypothetical protein